MRHDCIFPSNGQIRGFITWHVLMIWQFYRGFQAFVRSIKWIHIRERPNLSSRTEGDDPRNRYLHAYTPAVKGVYDGLSIYIRTLLLIPFEK